MDAEACTQIDGYPTGLAWYGGYREPLKKRPRTEPCWSQRLAELLPRFGFTAAAEVRYPGGGRNKCDVVAYDERGITTWIEVKGAWKEYWRGKSEWIYRSYLLHPLLPGLDATKTHTAALDLRKLQRLTRPPADRIALLVVGFDSSEAPMDPDIVEFANVAKLGGPPWQVTTSGWADAYRLGGSVKCWMWERPVDADAAAQAK
jgi:hypothetical protein